MTSCNRRTASRDSIIVRSTDGDSQSAWTAALGTKNMPSHHHKPLDLSTRSIRLLELHPGSGYDSISCTLSQHDLDDPPSYIALSYTWEQSGAKRSIVCNGMSLDIGENLWQFFCEYCRTQVLHEYTKSPSTKTFYLWVDAICIDQSNLKERNQQVAQMRYTYTRADAVIVWIGTAHGHEELAFTLTKHPDLLEVTKFQDELLSLLNKPYFSRVWVIQEFVLAKSISIWCGELSADVGAFDGIWNEDKALPGSRGLTEAIINTPAWPLFKHRRDYHENRRRSIGKPAFRLRDLLQSFDASQSSEVYDKIYGLLGIAPNHQTGARPIEPDYSKKPIELLVDVLRNQYYEDDLATNLDNYELLNLLLRTLRVSRADFTKYVLNEVPALKEHLYILITYESMITSLSMVSRVVKIGSLEHISSPLSHDAKATIVNSSRDLRTLSASDISRLTAAMTNHDTALGLQFEGLTREYPLLRKMIGSSMQSILQHLCQHGNDCDNSNTANHPPKPKLDLAQIRDSLSHSFTTAYTSARSHSEPHYKPHWYRKYATFEGTNSLIGIMCIDDAYDSTAEANLYICAFAPASNAEKCLVVQKRTSDEFVIVGFAITMEAQPDAGPMQSLQKMIWKTEPKRTDSWLRDLYVSMALEGEICFHCDVIDLLELGRCGILNGEQMDRLLEQTFGNEGRDEGHKCKRGGGACCSLEFGT